MFLHSNPSFSNSSLSAALDRWCNTFDLGLLECCDAATGYDVKHPLQHMLQMKEVIVKWSTETSLLLLQPAVVLWRCKQTDISSSSPQVLLFYQYPAKAKQVRKMLPSAKNHGKLIFNPPAPNHQKAATHTQTQPFLQTAYKRSKNCRKLWGTGNLLSCSSPTTVLLCVHLCMRGSDPHLLHTRTNTWAYKTDPASWYLTRISAVRMQGSPLYNLFLLSLPQSPWWWWEECTVLLLESAFHLIRFITKTKLMLHFPAAKSNSCFEDSQLRCTSCKEGIGPGSWNPA
jgi:hypothetical protein